MTNHLQFTDLKYIEIWPFYRHIKIWTVFRTAIPVSHFLKCRTSNPETGLVSKSRRPDFCWSTTLKHYNSSIYVTSNFTQIGDALMTSISICCCCCFCCYWLKFLLCKQTLKNHNKYIKHWQNKNNNKNKNKNKKPKQKRNVRCVLLKCT